MKFRPNSFFSENLTPTDTTTVNVDRVSFSYNTTEEFISRACGYIANYNTLEANLTEETEEGNWIRGIEVVISDIENSNETHVKIFH